MVVYQESTLTFAGGTIVNGGLIQVEGGLFVDSDVTISPPTTSSAGLSG